MDSYYQLVYYPAAASANVVKMQVFAGLNNYYYQQKSVLANTYADLVQKCIDVDIQLQNYYNKQMSGGKWDGIMSSAHIGYKSWNDEGWQYPSVNYITPKNDYTMIVSVEGSEIAYLSGTTELPSFTNLDKEAYSITISNGGGSKFDYNITTSVDWILVDQTKGTVYTGVIIAVTVDWDKVAQTSNGVLTITTGGNSIEVSVTAEVIDVSELEQMTFVETHDVVSIEAEHTSHNIAKAGAKWKVINNYGRSLSSLKMFPTDISFENTEDAPCLEYMVYVDEDTEYNLTAYTAPTNNLSTDSRLRYAVSFDSEKPITADSLPKNFAAGNSMEWNTAVMDNVHITATAHKLTKGTHTLRFYGLDAGLVLQKLVLSNGTLPNFYFGPPESYYVGKEVVQQLAIAYQAEK